MPLFRCDGCGCVENTALGCYWSKDDKKIWPAEYVGKALCSECGPRTYRDGTPTEYGQWHGRFDKRSAVGMLVDQAGFLWSTDESLPKHYSIVGEIGDDGKVRPTSTRSAKT